MSKYYLIIEDRENQYNQIKDVFDSIDDYRNVVNEYNEINEFTEVLQVNQPKNNYKPINEKIGHLLSKVKGDLTLLCDLNLYPAKSESQKLQQGINILKDLILPQIDLTLNAFNKQIIICTKYEEELIEPYFIKLNKQFLDKKITFTYVQKKFELSLLHDDFIEDLNNLLT
ncbi:hypothetical protein [Kordia sp.]|uniref:hypothetical protein n=1 Tax=Kordia sp. TaxID=1965332 RepID=UPI003D6A8F53